MSETIVNGQAHMLVLMFAFLAIETLNIKAMHQLWGRKVGDLGLLTSWGCSILRSKCQTVVDEGGGV
jgi:hypothetical protein